MPITDLTGYTWVGNSSLNIHDVYETYNISGNYNFDIGSGGSSGTFTALSYYLMGRIKLPELKVNGITSLYSGNWQGPNPVVIDFTGGTDATNSTLIAWLEANGTLTAPVQANTYNLTHTLTNLTKGNITLQITPDTNYTYPTSLTISNGTIVSYDNTTGVAVISGDDTTVVSGECVEQASGYDFTMLNDTLDYTELNGNVESGTFLNYVLNTNIISFKFVQPQYFSKLNITSGKIRINGVEYSSGNIISHAGELIELLDDTIFIAGGF